MAIDTQKYTAHAEHEVRHSALLEFSRDERRPAVLLLSALMLSTLFFGIGLMVGRWTAEPDQGTSIAASATTASTPVPAPAPQTTPSNAINTSAAVNTSPAETLPNVARPYSLLVATYDTVEKAETLIKDLQEAGYPDIRNSIPRAGETRPRYSVLVGRFTQDEAMTAAKSMRAAKNPRLKNVKVIEAAGN